MLGFSETILQQIVVHKVGNKYNEENIHCSKEILRVDDEVKELLSRYFLTPFKSEEYFQFYHDSDLHLNEVYHYVSKIFDDSEQIIEQSVNLARHLYEKSTHPNIKGGEFYTVYFKEISFNNEPVDAVGLFK